MLTLRLCSRCSWLNLPEGMSNVTGDDKSKDRTFHFQTMYPNVVLPFKELRIMVPTFPLSEKIAISGYYSCENCPPTDPKKPQTLWLQLKYPKK
jgi:hypothetical protein